MTGVAGGRINPSIPSAGPKASSMGDSFGSSAPREKRGAFLYLSRLTKSVNQPMPGTAGYARMGYRAHGCERGGS